MQMPVTQGQYSPLSLRWSWLVAAGLTLVAVALGFLAVPNPRDVVAAVSILSDWLNAGGLRDALHPLGIWAPVVYMLVQATQVLVPFLPGAPVTFAGVLLFGWQAGLFLSMVGFMLGSALQFAAVRRWGRPLVVRLAGEEIVSRSAGKLHPRGWWLLAAFLVPFAPADAFSALAALSPISFRRFLLVSFLGRLPWAAGTVLLAAGLISGSIASWAAAGLALVALAAVGIAYRLRSGRATSGSAACP
ncbi:MAG: TVP38/TMEM64 family protein [Dehalococcoidia bacterium]